MTNQNHQLHNRLQKVKGLLQKNTIAQLFVRTIEGSGNHDVGQRAAGVAYYTIVSMFPLVLGLIAVFGFIFPAVNLQDQLLEYVSKNLPGATNLFEQNISGVIELRGSLSVLSIVILFWGGSGMFSSISLAINRAWEIRHHRPFFIRKISELGMALSTGILFVFSLGASALTSFARGSLDLPIEKLISVDIGSRFGAFLLMVLVFLLLYKLIPNTKTYWRYVLPGALIAAFFFEIARTLFFYYIANFANYELIYGSITSVIALLVWIYYSAFIMILGAEYSFQYSNMRGKVTPLVAP